MSVQAGWLPLAVDIFPRRWTPYRFTIAIRNFDFSEATFAMQVRRYRDAKTALITLGNAAPGAQGISCTYGATGPDGALESTIIIEIAETTIEALPFPTPRGGDLRLVWDMHITGGGLEKRRWFEGDFTVKGGATQNG